MDRQEVDAEPAEARAGIKNNPNLSDARKQQMLQQLEQQSKAVDRVADSTNKAAVAPYRDRLMALSEEDETPD